MKQFQDTLQRQRKQVKSSKEQIKSSQEQVKSNQLHVEYSLSKTIIYFTNTKALNTATLV